MIVGDTMEVNLINGRVYNTQSRQFEEKTLSFENGIIAEALLPHGVTIDCRGKYIAPGYIDIHTHGGARHGFASGEIDDMHKSFNHYLSHGTSSIFATSATESIDNVIRLIEKTAALKGQSDINIAGFHVEGPYLSEAKRGAHRASLLKKPDVNQLYQMLNVAGNLKLRVTVAPELDGAIEYIKEAVKCGVEITLGHTNADAKTIYRAIESGAGCITHLFNAMSPMSHREPGCVGAALCADVYTEVICDGFHICPDIVRLTYGIKKDKFVIITDSLSAAGVNPTEEYTFESAGLTVYYKDGKALLADGTIAGSTLDMHTGVLNLCRFADIPFERAIYHATCTPAMASGVYDTIGSLEVGKRADILLLNEDYSIASLYVGGVRTNLSE